MSTATSDSDRRAEVRVGTSGYSFEDWRGVFYPENVVKGKMLDYYVQHFPTVEINSTYYRVPHPAVMANMVKKAPRGFDFMVKVPQSFTHVRQNFENDRQLFLEALRPLDESGKLAGLVAQFPFSFKYNQNHLDYLSLCRELVAPHHLFVEFRHDSWVNRGMYDRLRQEGIGYVAVDEPQLPHLLKPDCFATTNIGYVRMHGRNAEHWWAGGSERYDWDYSPADLRQWRDKVEKLRNKVERIYVFFNNCHLGQAAANARDFLTMMSG